eukprot:6176139-Pleurochrysis_carterae.AAC.1
MTEPSTVSKSSWDSFQLAERTWLDDLLSWISTCNPLYATLTEHGYSLTPQGCVVVYSADHAKAVFCCLYQTYTFDSPSLTAPTLVFPTVPNTHPSASQTTSERWFFQRCRTRILQLLRPPAIAACNPARRPPQPATVTAFPPSQVYKDLSTTYRIGSLRRFARDFAEF